MTTGSLVIDLPTGNSFTIPAADTQAGSAADVATAIAGYLNSNYSTPLAAAGLSVTDSGTTVVFTGAAGVFQPAGDPVVSSSSSPLFSGSAQVAGINSDVDTVFAQATNTGPGEDYLDFTAYGDVRAVFVAQLDTTNYVSNTWTLAQDVKGHAPTDGVQNQTLAAHSIAAASSTPTVPEDYMLKQGNKYITLTREFGNTDPDQNTRYEIRLWTVNGDRADAYESAATIGNEARDTPQTIGYVDLGKVIEGNYLTADGVVAHIDYIV
jgi:hypothetical protein